MKEAIVYRGPSRAKIVLDSSQIFPKDPGMGTPVLVEWEGYTGTFNCCCQTGEIDGYKLPKAVCDWLNNMEPKIDDWLTEETKKKRA